MELVNPFVDPDDEICGKSVGPYYEGAMCYLKKHPVTVPHYDMHIDIYFITTEELDELRIESKNQDGS